MKLLYFADLHGDYPRCEYSIDLIKKHKPDVVVNGGDLLSINGEPFIEQPKFIKWFGKQLEDSGINIPYLLIPGNDDLKVHLPLLNEIEDKKLIINISGKKTRIGDYEFIGYSYIPNFSYMLKDWRKLDDKNNNKLRQEAQPVISAPGGYKPIDNLEEFMHNQSTIKQDLDRLPIPSDYSKTVYVMHCPPAGTDLDLAADGTHAGSRAIREFIDNKHPLLTLHGHIHESPLITGRHCVRINNTVSLHSGQQAFLLFDLEAIEDSLEVIPYDV